MMPNYYLMLPRRAIMLYFNSKPPRSMTRAKNKYNDMTLIIRNPSPPSQI